MCPEIFNLWVIAERMHDDALAHSSRSARNVFNSTYHGRWTGGGLHALRTPIPWTWQQRGTSQACCGCSEIFATAPIALDGCRSPPWNAYKACPECHEGHFEHLEFTLSAIIHKINVSGHISIRTLFLFCYVKLADKIWPNHSVRICIIFITARSIPFLYDRRIYLCQNSFLLHFWNLIL
jgi:hypothetical protein